MKMNTYTATGIAEGFIPAESEDQVIKAWQYLHDTRIGYQLQGFFGRQLTGLIEQGIIKK
jgi:hypothetical protein